jgi:hypothetical protein
VLHSPGDVGAPPTQFIVQREAEKLNASRVDELDHPAEKGGHWMNPKVRGNQPNLQSPLRPFLCLGGGGWME